MPKHAAKTDSMFARTSSTRKVGTGQRGSQQDVAEIHRLLDIEDGDKPGQGLLDKRPLKMMDLVFQEWEVDDDEAGEDGWLYGEADEDNLDED